MKGNVFKGKNKFGHVISVAWTLCCEMKGCLEMKTDGKMSGNGRQDNTGKWITVLGLERCTGSWQRVVVSVEMVLKVCPRHLVRFEVLQMC